MTPPEVAAADAKADVPEIAILSGNEAVARGAWEAGVTVATALPRHAQHRDPGGLRQATEGVYAEWSPNEKVAIEVGVGRLAGRRPRHRDDEARRPQRGRRPVLPVAYIGRAEAGW